MQNGVKYIICIIFICVIFIFKPKILKMFGFSYRDIYNISAIEEVVESIHESLDIQYIRYEWTDELEVDNNPTILVYHHAAIKNISPEDINNLHKNKGWRGIGYHYYIRKDGTIYKGREDQAEGSHVKGYNKKSIGVCLEGDFEEEYLTEEQREALKKLSVYICIKHNIKDILPHKELGNTLCPGKNFPLEEIKNDVIKELKKMK